MKLDLRWQNCLWLMVPLLTWNIVLGPRIVDERILSDAHSPTWLLIAENITRLGVFILPLLIPSQLEKRIEKAGMLVYLVGTLVYFASWLPLLLALDTAWSVSAAGALAPRLTPLIPFLGIALVGRSWAYGGLSVVFILLHTWHGVQNLT